MGNAIIYSTEGDIASLSRQCIICACVILPIMPIMVRMLPPKKHAGGG